MRSTGRIVAIFVAGAVGLSLVSGGISYAIASSGRVLYGVRANGVPLSGMTREETLAYFQKEGEKKAGAMTVSLSDGSHEWKAKAKDVGLTPKAKEAAEVALSRGRDGGIWHNLAAQAHDALFGYDVTMSAAYDPAALDRFLGGVQQGAQNPPANASVSVTPDGNIHHADGIMGRTVDMDAIRQEMAASLTKLSSSTYKVPIKEQAPPITTQDVANVNAVLGSYTTSFASGPRGENIAIAAHALNGVLLRSGATFSFNDTVGRRTVNAGYKNAPVLVDGKVEPGIGGGVCQVSSTLYNAMLLAGLTPVERSHHFFPSAYCPAGLDATVADDLIDLKVKNPLPHNVYIVATTVGNNLTIRILGTKEDLGGQTISMDVQGSRQNPSVYRVYSANGTETKREFMHTDQYS